MQSIFNHHQIRHGLEILVMAQILVMNLANVVKCIKEREIIAEIHEACELREGTPTPRTAHGTQYDEEKIDINPALPAHHKEAMVNLLQEFKNIFAWDKSKLGQTTVCEMAIPLTEGTPVHQPPYRVSHREREIIRGQVDEMIQRGVIRESSSSYASPVVLVKKKNDEWRFCVDYRKLNEKLVHRLSFTTHRGHSYLYEWLQFLLYP